MLIQKVANQHIKYFNNTLLRSALHHRRCYDFYYLLVEDYNKLFIGITAQFTYFAITNLCTNGTKYMCIFLF